jgi:hypothetical protein
MATNPDDLKRELDAKLKMHAAKMGGNVRLPKKPKKNIPSTEPLQPKNSPKVIETPKDKKETTEPAYELTEKALAMADAIMAAKGTQNMMTNPVMSSIKKNPARDTQQKQKLEKTQKNSNNTTKKEKSKKDPTFSTVAPGNIRLLKVGDSESDILGKMYNFMVKRYEEKNKYFNREKKYKKILITLKEKRIEELISLFGGKYKKETSKQISSIGETKGIVERIKDTGKTIAEKAGGVVKSIIPAVKKTIPTAAKIAVGAAAVVGTKNVIAKVLEVGPGYNVVQRPDGTVEKQQGARNWRNNNPGNIEYKPGGFAEEQGAIGPDGRFAIFPTYEMGRKAKEKLIFEGKNYKDLDLKSAIARYAPPTNNAGQFENDTADYQKKVLSAVGGENKTMSSYSQSQRESIMNAMEQKEGFKVGKVATISSNKPSSVSNAPKPINPLPEIPEKIKVPNKTDSSSVSMLNNTTNIINGGTTYSVVEEKPILHPALIDKQYYNYG